MTEIAKHSPMTMEALLPIAQSLRASLKQCMDYIEQSAAHSGRLIASQDLPAAIEEFRNSVSRIETGPWWGPVAAVDLTRAREILASSESIVATKESA